MEAGQQLKRRVGRFRVGGHGMLEQKPLHAPLDWRGWGNWVLAARRGGKWAGPVMLVGGVVGVAMGVGGRGLEDTRPLQQSWGFSQIQRSLSLSHGASFHFPMGTIMMQSSRPMESLGSPRFQKLQWG